jgi:phosphoglycerate kinase
VNDQYLTIDDVSTNGKAVLLRADLNTPVDGDGKLIERLKLEEAVVSINDFKDAKLVVISHQGRVGRDDFIELRQHAGVLSELLQREVKFVPDVMGPTAIQSIKEMKDGEILMLDNLRLMAEENTEIDMVQAANSHMVRRLAGLFDLFVLDAFPTAHRSHPSIVGFPYFLPTVAGRLIIKELKALNMISMVEKGPYTTMLGGAKINDRLESIISLIRNHKADKVLLSGTIGLSFLKAAGRIDGYDDLFDNSTIGACAALLEEFGDLLELPVDLAYEDNGERKEVPVAELPRGVSVLDIGSSTVDRFSKIIRSSGTVFVSGTPGVFERKNFDVGTREILMAVAKSAGTTIVSGGHTSTAVKRLNIPNWIDYISTSGGALIQYLSGKPLPLFEALKYSAQRLKDGGYSLAR